MSISVAGGFISVVRYHFLMLSDLEAGWFAAEIRIVTPSLDATSELPPSSRSGFTKN
jgi:hypothetical protein